MLVCKTDDYKLVIVVLVEPFCFWSTVITFAFETLLNHHCSTKLAEKQACFQEHVHLVSIRMLLC